MQVDASAPDVVFCGEEHGREHRRYPRALKILLQHENRYPDFSTYHYALGLRALDHPRWFRLPLYVRTTRADQLIKGADFGLAGLVNFEQAFCVDGIQTEPSGIEKRNVRSSLAYGHSRPLLTFTRKY